MAVPDTIRDRDLDPLFDELSNWGRWGDDDQSGTLNFITEDTRRAASRLVRDGRVISISQPLSTESSADNQMPVVHTMHRLGGARSAATDAPAATEGEEAHIDWSAGPEVEWSADGFTVYNHGIGITHLDALCHMDYKGRLYNGYPADTITARGAQRDGIDVLRHGVVTRGVLLDFPRLLGMPWVEPGTPLHPSDLEGAEVAQGVHVGSGDALLIRTGRFARNRARGDADIARDGAAGLHASCLPWLRDREVALLGSECVSDVVPSGFTTMLQPIHTIGLVSMGLHLLDNADLDELAAACGAASRSEFLFVIAPLVLVGGTGSPVNPLAVL
jgi:kynurenine formamidase